MLVALLILAGFFTLAVAPQTRRQIRDRTRQPIANFARHGYRVQNCWKKPCTIAAHATGKLQPERKVGEKFRQFTGRTGELAKLEKRAQQTVYPEWKMRFTRALHRMAAQLDRNARGGCLPYKIKDRFSENVGDGRSQNENPWEYPASRWTMAQASYQARFTHPGMLCDQPQRDETRGVGNPTRPINREESPVRVATVLGAWPLVRYYGR